MGKRLYNYWIVSADSTIIVISASTSECNEIFTLNSPIDFISLTGCIIDGFIFKLSFWRINFAISVGLTEPYNSLFSVLSFFTLYFFLFICSKIFFASFFFSLSFFSWSAFIFSSFEISVGFTEPYNSLFSVLSFFTEYVLLLIFSEIFCASAFLSLSFFARSAFIFSTCEIFSLEAYKAFLFAIKKFLA